MGDRLGSLSVVNARLRVGLGMFPHYVKVGVGKMGPEHYTVKVHIVRDIQPLSRAQSSSPVRLA